MYCLFEKTENKQKKRPGLAQFKKKKKKNISSTSGQLLSGRLAPASDVAQQHGLHDPGTFLNFNKSL